jgi:hypothetical protein
MMAKVRFTRQLRFVAPGCMAFRGIFQWGNCTSASRVPPPGCGLVYGITCHAFEILCYDPTPPAIPGAGVSWHFLLQNAGLANNIPRPGSSWHPSNTEDN